MSRYDDRGWSYGREPYGRSMYSRGSHKSSSSSSRDDDRSRYGAQNRREDGHSTDSASSSIKKREKVGLKEKDIGYALIGEDKIAYVNTQLKSQLKGVPLSDESPNTSPTPARIVEELKRSGQFDALRKDMLKHFQESSHKQPLLEGLQAYLLQRLADMPSEQKQRLIQQDIRLRHSEMTKWLEEGKGSADVLDDLFVSLRKDIQEGKVVRHDGDRSIDMSAFIDKRIDELVQSEHAKLSVSVRSGSVSAMGGVSGGGRESQHGGMASADEDEDAADDSSEKATTNATASPLNRNLLTPMAGRETPGHIVENAFAVQETATTPSSHA